MIEGTIYPTPEEVAAKYPEYYLPETPTPQYSSNSSKTNYIESSEVGGEILLQDDMDGVLVTPNQNILSQLVPAVVGGVVSSPVGARDAAGRGYRMIGGGKQLNSGADIVGGDGNIQSMYGGKVISVSDNGSDNYGFGNSVTLEYDIDGQKVYNRFSHLASVNNLKVGQQVAQGYKLGVMGATGNVTGVHLDNELYQIKNNKKYFQDTSSLYN